MSSAAVRGSARGALGTYTGAAEFASSCMAERENKIIFLEGKYF